MVVSILLRMLIPSLLLALSTRKREHSASGQRMRFLRYLVTPYRMIHQRPCQTYSHFTVMFNRMETSTLVRCVFVCVCVCERERVLIVRGSLEKTAEEFKIEISQAKELLAKCHEALYNERQKRPKPHCDDKIPTAWNGEVFHTLSSVHLNYANVLNVIPCSGNEIIL